MKNFWISAKITIAMCLLLGVGYVAVLRLTAAVASKSHGEVATVALQGKTVGVEQVGQNFESPRFFWGRPSAVDYDGAASGGSNKATTNPQYLVQVEHRIKHFMAAHPYLSREEVPAEMVTASGSGLDPHISPRGAAVQVKRVAKARHLNTESVQHLVDSLTERPWLGLFGTPTVNVLKLNVALETLQPTVASHHRN